MILLSDTKEKVYVLKNYNNATQNKLLPVINYEDYIEKSNADNGKNKKIGRFLLSGIKEVEAVESSYYKELENINDAEKRGVHFVKYLVRFTNLTKNSGKQIDFLKHKIQELLNIEFLKTMNGIFRVGWNKNLGRSEKHYLDNITGKILLDGQYEANKAYNRSSWDNIDPSTYPKKGMGWQDFIKAKTKN